jgi:hypothetical protein
MFLLEKEKTMILLIGHRKSSIESLYEIVLLI